MTVRNSARTASAVLDGAAGRPIRYTLYDTIAESLNHRFSRSGMRHCGYVFDPAYEVTGATYTTASASSARTLDTLFPTFQTPRRAGTMRTKIRIFGANIYLRVLPWRFSRPTSVSTFSYAYATIASTSNVWSEAVFSTTWAGVHENGVASNELAVMAFQFSARAYNTGAGNGKVYALDIYQEFISSGDIPTAAP